MCHNTGVEQLRTWARTAPGTAGIAVVILMVWLVGTVQSGRFDQPVWGSSLAEALMLYGPDATPVSIVGNMFVHAGLTHLVMNGLFLVLFGREVEWAVGTPMMLCCFFIGGLGASAGILSWTFMDPTVGASGALCALLVLTAGIVRRRGDDLRAIMVLIVVNVVLSALWPTVSWSGHVGGALTGMVLIPVIYIRRPVVRWAWSALCAAAVVGAVGFAI